MQSKKGPFILIVLLVIILVFIVGVRYGQRVENTNKTLSLILSLTPTGPAPTKALLRFATYTSKACNIQFIYPSSISLVKQSTSEARLNEGGNLAVGVSCAKKPSFESFFAGPKVATQEVTFQKQKYNARVRKTDNQKYLLLTLRNGLGNPISIAVEEKLLPLLESSFIFLR